MDLVFFFTYSFLLWLVLAMDAFVYDFYGNENFLFLFSFLFFFNVLILGITVESGVQCSGARGGLGPVGFMFFPGFGGAERSLFMLLCLR